MTDRELLELAAKAHGGLVYVEEVDAWIHEDANGNRGICWNPLKNDAHAMRLAVKVGLIDVTHCINAAHQQGGDVNANARRLIVQTADEIGRAMP